MRPPLYRDVHSCRSGPEVNLCTQAQDPGISGCFRDQSKNLGEHSANIAGAQTRITGTDSRIRTGIFLRGPARAAVFRALSPLSCF